MDQKELLKFCVEKGILIDKEVLSLFEDSEDIDSVKLVLEQIQKQTKQRILTKNVFDEHKKGFIRSFSSLPEANQKKLEKLKINLGLSIEISRENISSNKEIQNEGELSPQENENSFSDVKVLSKTSYHKKKIEVKDFHNYFKDRFFEIKKILQDRDELKNLISINKISGTGQRFSIIGFVYSKRVTKNQNIMLEVEDLTGKIKVCITQNNLENYKKAEDLALDSIVGFSGSGNKEIVFANNIIFPDAGIVERKKSPVDESVLFISDVHVGSKNFMEDNFLRFIDYLNGKIHNTPESERIKYLFVVGDLIAGVGVYPNQEKELEIKDLESQYARAAELFGKIRKDIRIIILPGNHDCVRLAEPQPILDEKYAWPLFNLKNVLLTPNPSLVNIGEKKNFQGFDVLAYHGFSYPYYANNIDSLIKNNALKSPDKVMSYLLKNRHLAPTHSSVQSSPDKKDDLVIKTVPDIFVSGHTHKNAVSYYNNILVISNGCWEELMPYQEKMGFESDYCKVPMFNLKTRNVKILDFYEDKEEKGEENEN